ncbi:MAG TPA: alpha/beta hydrolase [Candidatus Nanopelagicaceae bacterium]
MANLVATARGDFAVEITGSATGELIVLVAGLGDDHRSWDGILPSLVSAYQCISFDNRGIGGSPMSPGPYTISELADDAHALTEALRLGPVVAIGSSMGGAICQEWALRYPSDLTRIVFTNTWAERDPYLEVLFEHWIALAKSGQSSAVMDSLLLFCLSPQYLLEHPTTIKDFRATPAPNMLGFAAAAAACRNHDALSRVSGINQPSLVIAGRRDILTRPSLSEHLTEALPNATFALVDAAHMTFWEATNEWTQVVTDWLTRTE